LLASIPNDQDVIEEAEPLSDQEILEDEKHSEEISEKANSLFQLIAQFNHEADKPLKLTSAAVKAALIHLRLIKEDSKLPIDKLFSGYRKITSPYNKHIDRLYPDGKYPRNPDFSAYLSYVASEPELEDPEEAFKFPDIKSPHQVNALLGSALNKLNLFSN
jgi:hypothetical protein